MAEKLGIFGGTFDPPHIGHQVLASEACAQLSLDCILWVLTPNPPHKTNQSILDANHRFEMVRKAVANDDLFELSTVELDRPGPHFAVDTLRELHKQKPEAELIYLMGADSLRDVISWHDPQGFLSSCHSLGVMQRPEININTRDLENKLPGINDKIQWIDSPLLEIASHDIRNRIRERRPFRYFVPKDVYEYIIANNLYM